MAVPSEKPPILHLTAFNFCLRRMSDLIFSPCFRGIASISHGEGLSAMYFGQHFKKYILKQGFLTITVMCCDESCRLLLDFVRTASFNDKHVLKDVKIVGSDSVILLLNLEDNLWNLSNVLQFWAGKGLCKYFTFTGLMQNCEKLLRTLPPCDLFDLMDCAFEEKESTLSQNYFETQTQLNREVLNSGNGFEPSSKAFRISDNIINRMYFQSEKGEDSLLNVSGIHLLAVFNFESEKCILLSFQNGKLIFILYRKLIDNACKSVVYLTKKLVSIEKFNYNGCAGLVWSDGIDLYFSKIEFNFDKPCFVKLVHFQMKDQIKGIKSVLKCNQCLLVVTLNRSFYLNESNKLGVTEELEFSSDKLLLELYKCATRISQLKGNLNSMAEFLKNKEMIEEGGFDLGSKGNQILLKSRVKGKLDKTYWKVRLLAKIKNKQRVEVKSFEADFSYGMTLKIESDLVLGGRVKVSLIGDFGCEFQVLVVKLGCVGKDLESTKSKAITKNLFEVAKKRKACLKVE